MTHRGRSRYEHMLGRSSVKVSQANDSFSAKENKSDVLWSTGKAQ